MVGIQSCYDFKVCKSHFPKPPGLGPVTYKCDLVYPFQIYQNLKKYSAYTQSMYNFTLRTIFFHTDTEILRILAADVIQLLNIKIQLFF
jgi:hypothetical protein